MGNVQTLADLYHRSTVAAIASTGYCTEPCGQVLKLGDTVNLSKSSRSLVLDHEWPLLVDAREIDREVFSDLHQAVPESNMGSTAGALTGSRRLGNKFIPLCIDADNILNFLVEAGYTLDEHISVGKDLPPMWVVFPSCFGIELVTALPLFASQTKHISPNRCIGTCPGLENVTIYLNDHIRQQLSPHAWHCPFGLVDSFAFVAAITDENAERPSSLIYGTKILSEKSLGMGILSSRSRRG